MLGYISAKDILKKKINLLHMLEGILQFFS